jgi:hypothetical protein
LAVTWNFNVLLQRESDSRSSAASEAWSSLFGAQHSVIRSARVRTEVFSLHDLRLSACITPRRIGAGDFVSIYGYGAQQQGSARKISRLNITINADAIAAAV